MVKTKKDKDVGEVADDVASIVYEVGYSIVPNLPHEKLSASVRGIKETIEALPSKILSEAYPERREFAYELTRSLANRTVRFREGYVGWIKFRATPTSVESLQKTFQLKDDIIRFIIVKTVPENTLYGDRVLKIKKVERNEERGEDKEEGKEAAIVASVESPKMVEPLVSEAVELDRALEVATQA